MQQGQFDQIDFQVIQLTLDDSKMPDRIEDVDPEIRFLVGLSNTPGILKVSVDERGYIYVAFDTAQKDSVVPEAHRLRQHPPSPDEIRKALEEDDFNISLIASGASSVEFVFHHGGQFN